MKMPPRPLSSLATLVLLAMGSASCGDDDVDPVTVDGGVADGPLAADAAPPADAPPPDATPADARPPDAGFPAGSMNPPKLWLAGINGSEVNLRLQPTEPPHF